MRVAIFAGGSGAVALQSGLYHLLEERTDGVDVKIIVNAYDNGRSTGVVRQVMNGQILGPSDVRKNHAIRCRLKHPRSPWPAFLDFRFTSSPADARRICSDKVQGLVEALDRHDQRDQISDLLLNSIQQYFCSPNAHNVEYEDFSLANIIYAGLAKANAYSLRAAATAMAEAMGLADCVLLNDDASLFLGAITRAGKVLSDEGDIVCWNNEADPIVDVFFTDADGGDTRPKLCFEAWRAIVEADLIILSSGTLWSSLLPTYVSEGFQAAIRESEAKVLMVMNRAPDKDSPGMTASDIVITLVPRYFDVGRLHVLADENGHPNLRTLDQEALAKVASFTAADLSKRTDPMTEHDATKLAEHIGYVYFKEYLHSNCYLFDYDDTLVGRGDTSPKSSRFNIESVARLNLIADVAICTGNAYDALDLRSAEAVPIRKPLRIFADGGINEYYVDTGSTDNGLNTRQTSVRCIAPDVLLPEAGPLSAESIIATLLRAGIPISKLRNRGAALIAIRPIDPSCRAALASLIVHTICDSNLEARLSGRSTVEICRPTLSKALALRDLLKASGASRRITYVGDECESGNDSDIARLAREDERVSCLHVSGPVETAFFLATVTKCLTSDANG